jgi:hypothetical protein
MSATRKAANGTFATLLRNMLKNKGIKIYENRFKGSLYADDDKKQLYKPPERNAIKQNHGKKRLRLGGNQQGDFLQAL